VVAATRLAQVAKMTLRPGAASDSHPSNEHPRSEQWVFVISGTGQAIVRNRRGAVRRVRLQPNSLLVIEREELHQLKNTGRRHLATLNFYVPPAYDSRGQVKSRAAGRG
jgi:oxalate decarboxylase/phosphoglucose isomerase-like protein (cupin superfamily)